ncbi:MAG: aminotransferase class I/II-fold pyridoxal phosphate-dependent enzyme [Oscillospiraceae bacterium]|nr:aminotransferase class I/II-fold pyridoxal phosphate-dependent enzyme [Oscillospiraceae bacterium]
MKYLFTSDYCELAHPSVLEAFSAVGNTQFEGYGLDEFSMRAAELVRELTKAPSADVHFISGGTHANLVMISSMLRPHEAVIAPVTGHIFVHEAGAIEATGHKVCTMSGKNGKLNAAEVEAVVKAHCDEHMVKPKLVYISQSTECGTVYNKAELTELSDCCKRNGLYLYMDGARLGMALCSHVCDLTYSDIAGLVDAFYIGGTKNGALFGEAIVICNDALKDDFRFLIKQRGAMLAKGAAIGVQFEALFKDGLYDRLAEHAVSMGRKLAAGIRVEGYRLLHQADTNLVIPVLPTGLADQLREKYGFQDWEALGDQVAIRLVTSWATPERMVDEFLADFRRFGAKEAPERPTMDWGIRG